MVSEDNVSRGKWPLARVEEVHHGKDGLVRTVTARAQRSALNRPVQHLHKLEIESAAPQASIKKEVPVHGGEKLKLSVVRVQSVPDPKRKLSVVLPDGGQGREDVVARTRSGRTLKRPNRLDL